MSRDGVDRDRPGDGTGAEAPGPGSENTGVWASRRLLLKATLTLPTLSVLGCTKRDAGPPQPQSRPRYEKPGIAWEETLDVRQTLAVACGKIAGGQGFCNAAQRS